MQISVLDWLDQTASAYAEKAMFLCGEDRLTFAQFQQYTKQIGTALATRVSPGNPIAALLGRHVLTPACFLGIVRAGCFYAPMDATMPIARLKQILSVVQSPALLTDRANLALAQRLEYPGMILVLEDLLETPVQEVLLQQAVQGQHSLSPLYVIFTSGSTGIPKGVVTSHYSLMSYLEAVAEVLSITDQDVLGGQAPLDYIAAVRDLYLPIKTGASTVILSKKEFAMPEQLFATLNRHRVTTLCWSSAGVELPAKLGAFTTTKPAYLKKLCFSGSVIHGKYLKEWQTHLPEVLYVNQYGPTEATASCTYHVVTETVTEQTVLPIGKPYRNYRILLLTEDNRQADVGEIGEICVSGPGLALGYYGNPEKTAESFVQNPLHQTYRDLIYRTGDLGHLDAQGVLWFHGRKDRQIKHMGHRIELGEIEGTAQQLAGIDDCSALYDKEKELLYLFYTGTATAKEIAIHFRSVLPAFMVPRKLIALETLPTLPNGKRDYPTLQTYFTK